MTLADRVKSLRIEMEWSMALLHRNTAALSFQTIYKIEDGTRPYPRISTLQQLATAFNMTLGEFLAPVVIDIED